MSDLKSIIQNAGIVGAGGAGFPSYAKLSDGADILVINCAECEPLMYTDYMLMREEMSKIVEGAQILIGATSIMHAYMSLKAHRAEMLGLTDGQVLGEGVTVKTVPDVYPMGDEINLIYEATGRLVKPGNLPITAGVIVLNGETVYNIRQAVRENQPLTEKWVTVGGDIPERYTVRVPIGMRVSELFSKLGITVSPNHVMIDGGPSMGAITPYETAVITKTTKAILILPKNINCVAHKQISMDDMLRRAASCCCGCNRCTELCPRNLLGYPLEPHKMIRAAMTNAVLNNPELIKTATLCCSCGVCAEAACCQDISPKDVILHLKSVLAKTGTKFVAGSEDYHPSSDRKYHLIASDKWQDILGVRKFDFVTTYIPQPISAKRVEIKMSQHIGAPSSPTVKVGDEVSVGQMIAEASTGLSVPQYASINGKVTFVDAAKIVIEA
ncbi:MAG: NADH-quinone oxidoreductase subunit J [Ruminococcaceae bacterium]|nr:NADH-quinone oxidoreductase subunit J [Oscillospiraceae bacterium]